MIKKVNGASLLIMLLMMSTMLIYITFLYYRVSLLHGIVSQREKYEKWLCLAEGALQIGIIHSKKYLLSNKNWHEESFLASPIKLKLDKWPMENSSDATDKKNIESYKAVIRISRFENSGVLIYAELYAQAGEPKLVQAVSCLLKRDGQLERWNIESQ